MFKINYHSATLETAMLTFWDGPLLEYDLLDPLQDKRLVVCHGADGFRWELLSERADESDERTTLPFYT